MPFPLKWLDEKIEMFNIENIDINEIYYSGSNNINTDVGIVFGKKVMSYDNSNKNRNGWIDSTSISKRQEMPSLFPGLNTIRLKVDNENIPENTFKIEYNTLYRGL